MSVQRPLEAAMGSLTLFRLDAGSKHWSRPGGRWGAKEVVIAGRKKWVLVKPRSVSEGRGRFLNSVQGQ